MNFLSKLVHINLPKSDVLSKHKVNIVSVLKEVYGLNDFQIGLVLKIFGISYSLLGRSKLVLSNKVSAGILSYVEKKLMVEYRLGRRIYSTFERLRKLKFNRFRFYEMNKPVRGQRTKTNASTVKRQPSYRQLKLEKSGVLSERLIK